jgi:heat shock protein HtpX
MEDKARLSGGSSALKGLDALAAQPEMRARISAYPGNLTFLDLIAKNKRQSTVLMTFMIILAVMMGCVLAAAIVAYGSGAATVEALIPSAVLGGAVALVVGLLAAMWSWYGGASAILTMSGAQPVTREMDLELWNVVEELSIAAGLPMPRVYIIPESALNAFATGRDPQHAAVAITSGLRMKLTREELQGVLAHEMAHVRHLDIRFAMLMATMAGLIVFAADAFWRVLRVTGGRGSRKKEGGAIVLVLLVFAVLLSIVAPIVARMIQMAYSREREYLADAGAVELTRNPQGLASALHKLAEDADPLVDAANRGTAHLYIVNPLRKMREAHQALNTVMSSHPPIQERIARLMALAR